MTALPDLNVTGAVVGQTFTVDFRNNIVSATLGQQYGDASDVLLIYNLSPCNFQVMLTATNRTFNLPAGVTSNAIPLSYRGTSDTGLKLLVKSLVVSGTPNTVSFDWFRPGEPILSAPATNIGLGSVSLSSISASAITFPTPNNWVIQQDGSGNLTFTNTLIPGAEFFLDAGASIHIPNSTIANVDGQATTGNYGIPLIIAQSIRQHVTTTSALTIVSFTTPASCIYRANAYITLDAAAGPRTINLLIACTDTTLGTLQNFYFTAYNPGTGGTTLLASASLANAFGYPTEPLVVDAQGGTNFQVDFQDSTASPNDYVTVVIERLG